MVLRHEEDSRTARSGGFREGDEGHNHSEQSHELGKTLLSYFFRCLLHYYLTFTMDPRLYDVQAAIDASFALAQQGNEGTSGSERVVVDVTNDEEMPLACTSHDEGAGTAMLTVEDWRYCQVIKRLKREMPVPVSKNNA